MSDIPSGKGDPKEEGSKKDEFSAGKPLKLESPKKRGKRTSEKKDQSDIIIEIFNIYSVMFKTTKKTPTDISIPRFRDFRKIYEVYCSVNIYKDDEYARLMGIEPIEINKLKYEIVSDGSLNTKFKSLQKDTEKETAKLLVFDQDKWDEWFGKFPFPWKYYDVIHIFRGARVDKKSLEVDRKETKAQDFRANLIVRNKGSDEETKKSFLKELFKMAGVEVSLETGEPETKAKEEEEIIVPSTVKAVTYSDYLASFENQNIYRSWEKYNITLYYKDILGFMEGNLQRVCPICNYRVISPNEEMGIDSVDNNGGLVEHPNFSIKIDPLVARLTRIAYWYRHNKPTRYFTIDDVIGLTSDPKPKSVGISFSSEEAKQEATKKYNEIQKGLRNALLCPECKKEKRETVLDKFGLYYIDEVLEQTLDSLKERLPVLFVGIPGDGKSTLAELFLQYCHWRYNVPSKTYNVNDSTTAGKLQGRLNLQKAFAGDRGKELPNVIYGILSLSLMKKGYGMNLETGEGGGLACNLLLDEFNRAEFKQIAFIMGFLQSPYKFTIDDDNYREIFYPNQKDTRWVFFGTMNTEDVGNEDLSIAGKSRFGMINVGYDVETLKKIIASRLNVPLESAVTRYLMTIYDFTKKEKNENNVRFESGVRNLIRVHEIFKESIAVRAGKYTYYVAKQDQLGEASTDILDKASDIDKYSNFNLYGQNIGDKKDIFLQIMDNVVKTHLLNQIVDENAKSRKQMVFDNWIPILSLIAADVNTVGQEILNETIK